MARSETGLIIGRYDIPEDIGEMLKLSPHEWVS